MSELREKLKHFMEIHLICTWNELNTKEMLLDQILAAFKAHIDECEKPSNDFDHRFVPFCGETPGESCDPLCRACLYDMVVLADRKKLLESLGI